MHRIVRPLPSFALWAMVIGGWGCPSRAAESPRANLTVGRGWAVVQEYRALRLERGVQEVELQGIPLEADLSTLVLRTRRVPIDLLEWQRKCLGPPGPAISPGLSLSSDGKDAIWTPSRRHRVDDEVASEEPVACRIYSPRAGSRNVALSYVVSGFNWKAHYQIAVRGELEEEVEQVSADLFGTVRITNPTAIEFSGANIQLIGSEEPVGPDTRGDPGFLILDEGPLAELWLPEEREPLPGYTYLLQGPTDLAARGQTDVSIASAVRVPAERVYVITAENYPLGVGFSRPLRKYITFKNMSGRGLGRSLPPGLAQVYLGGTRGFLVQEGRFRRTLPKEEIRIDLGYAQDVLGSRRTLGRANLSSGFYEESFEVVIQNRRESNIFAEVDEKPPLQLQWNVVQASEKYFVERQRLRFKPTVEAKSDERILYQLRVRLPGI